MKRRLVAVVAAVLLLAACSSGSSKSTTPTTATASETQAYADAVAAGLIAGTPAAARTALRRDTQCVARAIVDGIGVARLHAAGVTLAALRRANFEPPKSVAESMTPSDRTTLATKLQACAVGRFVGSQISLDFATAQGAHAQADPREVACFGRGFGGEVARPMIAGMMLDDLSVADANRLATVTVTCVGLVRIFENASGLTLSDAETQCVEQAGQTDGTGTALVRLLAGNFRGEESTARTAGTRFGVRVVSCLTPAHLTVITGR